MDYGKDRLADRALLLEIEELRRREAAPLPHLLACLAEVERRGLHLDLGYTDLFDFCRRRLGYSDGAAARRIHAARAAAAFPDLYAYIRDGQLSLSAVSRLKPHLTRENFARVASRAAGMSFREVDALAVELAAENDPPAPPPAEEPPLDVLPLSDAPPPHREERASPEKAEERKRDVIRAERPGVIRVSFQADAALRERLDTVKALLSRRCPNGRLEDVITVLVGSFLERHDPSRSRAAAPRPARARKTRRIPRWVKDAVWRRDAGRCSYRADDGTPCGSRRWLEYDHVTPWARGGVSDDPANVRLLCRAHNLRMARRTFGDAVPAPRGRSPQTYFL